MRFAASVPGGIVGNRPLSCVPSHQRRSAPKLAPIEIATTDFHCSCPLLQHFEEQGEMTTLTVPAKRRHHQPLWAAVQGGMPSPSFESRGPQLADQLRFVHRGAKCRGAASPEPFPADPCDSHVRPTGARKTIRSMRLSRTMEHPSIATHRRRPLHVGALCSAAKAVSREGPCPFGVVARFLRISGHSLLPLRSCAQGVTDAQLRPRRSVLRLAGLRAPARAHGTHP